MATPTKYTRAQIATLISENLITQKQVDEQVKKGTWVISERAAGVKKEKHFHSDDHKAFYEAQAAIKAEIKPMFEAIRKNPKVEAFLKEWGDWEDTNGEFSLSVEWYVKGSNRAERTFGD